MNHRFGWRDLASILNAHPPTTTRRAAETRSLSQGTAGWAQINRGGPVANGGDTSPVVDP